LKNTRGAHKGDLWLSLYNNKKRKSSLSWSFKVAKLKTKFSQLVTLKKKALDKSEQVVTDATQTLQNAKDALQESYTSLKTMQAPQNGDFTQLQANRVLLNSQRALITHNHEWINFAQQQLQNAKEQLKKDSIEYEKFKYLELQEVKKILQEQKKQEAKELDEIALMTFKKNKL